MIRPSATIPIAFEHTSFLQCGPRDCPDMKAFGPFRLDTVSHWLWRDDKRVPLTPKAFDVLRYLIEHADRLVTLHELLEALWPETYVNPEGIRKYILEIRKVLRDRSDQPAFIETFPKRGYQFIATYSHRDRRANSFACGYSPRSRRGYGGASRRTCEAGWLFTNSIGRPATGGLRNGRSRHRQDHPRGRVPASVDSSSKVWGSGADSALRIRGKAFRSS